MKAYEKILAVVLVGLAIQLTLGDLERGEPDLDVFVSRAFTVTSNTDSIVSRAFTVTSNTDSIVSRAFTVTSNTDSIVSRAFTAVNCDGEAGGLCPDCDGDGIPDQCEIDCGDDDGPCDLEGCGQIIDCNDNGIPDECDPGACCEGNGTCTEGLDAACVSGIWVIDALCAPNPCPTPPAVQAVGSRYIQVTPNSGDPGTAVALYVTSPAHPCLGKYVAIQSGVGRLIDVAEFRLPGEWGAVSIADEEIMPSTDYHVQVENTLGMSDPGIATTWLWADANNSGGANFVDIQLVIFAFQGNFDSAALEAVDLWPCTPDGVPNFADVLEAVFAFQGQTYADRGCPQPCP